MFRPLAIVSDGIQVNRNDAKNKSCQSKLDMITLRVFNENFTAFDFDLYYI